LDGVKQLFQRILLADKGQNSMTAATFTNRPDVVLDIVLGGALALALP
jgi:hypothetical protein